MPYYAGNGMTGPNFNLGWDPQGMADFIEPAFDARRKKQEYFHKDLINLQLTNRLKEFDQQLHAQQDYERQHPQQPNVNIMPSSPGGGLGPGHDLFQMAKDEQARKDALAGNELERRRVDISQQNANTARERYEDPNLIPKVPRGGNIMAFDPKTGQMTDTGVSTGTMTQPQYVATTQANTAANINQRTAGQLANTVEGGEQARQTKAQPPVLSPGQETQNAANNANRVAQLNPRWQKWIHIDPNTGQYRVDPPSRGMLDSGPSPQEWATIMAALNGPQYPRPGVPPPQQSVNQLPTAPVQQAQPQTAPQPQRVIPPNQIRVKWRNPKTGKDEYMLWDKTKGRVPPGYTIVAGGQQE